MALEFPSLAYFQALQQRTLDAKDRFEKLGYCDTTFGVKIGDALYSIAFEVYECTGVREGGDPAELDFILAGAPEVWKDMVRSIVANGGADTEHTLNTLSHVGERFHVEYVDPEGYDKYFRFMASLQEFFDQTQHLEVRVS